MIDKLLLGPANKVLKFNAPLEVLTYTGTPLGLILCPCPDPVNPEMLLATKAVEAIVLLLSPAVAVGTLEAPVTVKLAT